MSHLSDKLLLTESNAKQYVKDKKVLLRVDFNVPIDKDQQITSDLRIRAALPTIELLRKEGEAHSLIIISHLGRPNGKVVAKHSLKPVAAVLERFLER